MTVMVCLVGENPLPIYLSLVQLMPPGGTAVLLHSRETEEAAQAIERRLGGRVTAVRQPIKDPFDPVGVRNLVETVRDKYPDAVLNYTGGTKVMSAAGFHAWADWPDRTVYLDEKHSLFRFGNGANIRLEADYLTVEDLCNLHDVKPPQAKPAAQVTFADLVSVFNGRDSLPYFEAKSAYPEWIRRHPQEWGRCLSLLSETTRANWAATEDRDGELQFQFFAHHEWPELLVKALVERLPAMGNEIAGEIPKQPLFVEGTVHRGVEFFVIGEKNNRKFEVDVITVRKGIVRYLSVTTSKDKDVLKGKAFQAIHRARQIGGDLARVCVVCTVPPVPRDNILDDVKESVSEDRFCIFAARDIAEWLPQGRRPGNGASLRLFLT
jgi:hypothetical protein